MKTRLSESQAEAEELNKSQSLRTCIVISLSYRFFFRLRQSYSYPGYQMGSFVGHRPTRLRLSAEDTSSKAAIIKKKPLFARVTFQKLTEARNWAWKVAWKAWLRKSKTSSRTEASLSVLLPVSLCSVQITGSLGVKRCDLFWASSSLVSKDWH